jgi:hypothetical protein
MFLSAFMSLEMFVIISRAAKREFGPQCSNFFGPQGLLEYYKNQAPFN